MRPTDATERTSACQEIDLWQIACAKMAFEVRVQYFAAARELCGCAEERVMLPETPMTLRALSQLIAARHARLAPWLARMRFAVNSELACDEATPIRSGDEIAVLPPLAGGSATLCGLRATPLSLDEVFAAVRSLAAGGIALFVGSVRDHAGDKRVSRLDYEAHPELAARELARICDEICARDPGLRVAALHRTGELAIGEIAVIVAASAPHREQAFAACRELIEQIKLRVPIWKKEWSPDGEASWVNLEG
jgi:MoaE-MoaD fusion protein